MRYTTFSILQNQQSSTTLKNGLLSVWEFEEGSGNIIDLHGSNDITPVNFTYGQSGLLGNCISMSGNGYGVLSSSPTAGKSEITASFWINPTSNDSARTLYDEYLNTNTWQFTIRFDEYITRDSSTGTSGSRDNDLILPNISINQWSHVVFVYSVSNGYKRIYLNGDLIGFQETTTSVDTLTSDRTSFRLGFGSDGTNYTGRIDQTAFWDRVLTDQELITLYNSGSGLNYLNW